MVGTFYQIPTFFVTDFSKRECVRKKVTFSTRVYKEDASSHFLIGESEASQSKNHFCQKMELVTHILDCGASQYTPLECVKGPRLTNMWLLFSAAVNVNRCISKYAFRKWGYNSQITQFGMRGLAFQFRMWLIQRCHPHFQFGLRGLAIQIENGIIYQHFSVDEHEKD